MGNELEKSIAEDLSGISVDFIETGIDAFLSDGPLKDFPVIGTILSFYKLTKNTHDYMFSRKILHFLAEIKDIPKEKRTGFIKRIDDDPRIGVKCGEYILSILDRVDTKEKAKLVGFLFREYIDDTESYQEYLRIISLVDRMFWPDMVQFANMGLKGIKIHNRCLYDTLISNGLITIMETGSRVGYSGGSISGELNDLGRIFQQKLFAYFSKG